MIGFTCWDFSQAKLEGKLEEELEEQKISGKY